MMINTTLLKNMILAAKEDIQAYIEGSFVLLMFNAHFRFVLHQAMFYSRDDKGLKIAKVARIV